MSTSKIRDTAVSQINDQFLMRLFLFVATSNTNGRFELSNDELYSYSMIENREILQVIKQLWSLFVDW